MIEYQGDNRIRRLLPILYKSVKFEKKTIEVPVDARDSDLGLPDYGRIARKCQKPAKIDTDSMVGSVSVLNFRDEVEK